jgi:streptogramin lyase
MSRKTGRLLTATLAAGLVLSMGGAALAAPATRTLKQFKVPTANSQPRAITNGSDGNRWFTETDANVNFAKIARITPSGAVTEFTPGPADGCNSCVITDIAQGPNNILYITNNSRNLMRFNIATLSFESPVVVPTQIDTLFNVAVSATDVWVTQPSEPAIYRYHFSDGAFTRFAVRGAGDVAVDPAGNAWFTEPQANDDLSSNIGRIDAATGAVTRTVVNAAATDVAVSPADGKVWFSARFPNDFTSTGPGVGFVDPANGNQVQFFEVPLSAGPASIAAGTDGSVWFTQTSKGNAASITNAGVITEFKAVKGSGPEGIVVAPNGDPWYTMRDANKIAALVSK